MKKEGQTVIGFIGLGLIGGSIAKTLRRNMPDVYMMAYSRTRSKAAAAVREGVINEIIEKRDEKWADCDYIFLCAPVETNIGFLDILKPIIKPGCIITDVGSVKGDMHAAVRERGMIDCFIGGHPMAGSEKTGYENANDHLIENAYYIVTPEENVPLQSVFTFIDLVKKIGGIPLVISEEEHDYLTAGISHLPHIVASCLVNTIARLDNEEKHMKMIAAGGFKDITRIASSSPEMWQQICLTNKKQISFMLDQFIRSMVQAKYLVDNSKETEIWEMFASGRDYRNSIPNTSGNHPNQSYVIFCDLLDETGGIAVITTLLASKGINIKNIGIINNREYDAAALRIEFYEHAAFEHAAQLLSKHNITIFKREG